MLATELSVSPEDFPLDLFFYGADPVALVKPLAHSALPFSARACKIETVTSMEELSSKRMPIQRDWAINLRLSVSLSPSAKRHWLLVTSRASGEILSESFELNRTRDIKNCETLLVTVGELAAHLLETPGEHHAFLMSEMVSFSELDATMISKDSYSSAIVSSDSSSTTVVASPSKASERVVLADTARDIALAVADIIEEALSTSNGVRGNNRTCVLWPHVLSHPVCVHSEEEARRVAEHAALLLPRVGLLGWEQRITSDAPLARAAAPAGGCFDSNSSSSNVTGGNSAAGWRKHLVTNPHTHVKKEAGVEGGSVLLTSGSYDYYHYRVDGFKDDGWGCAYRSLQTLLSWFQHAGWMGAAPIPTHRQIQQILSEKDPDKTGRHSFVGSSEWIGSFEVMMVLQHFMPSLDCIIRRLESGADLDSDSSVQQLLVEHFSQKDAPPVMIGGSSYAHTIVGVSVNADTMEARYLIVDPHYAANTTDMGTAVKKGFVGWKQASKFFEASSWYNMCIPRADIYDPR